MIYRAIIGRERLGSTGMGGGVAIPHARIPDLKEPFGVLVRLTNPIDFDAVDSQPVDIVFMLLTPPAPEGDQLNALACVARKLTNPGVVSHLRQAADDLAMYEAVATKSQAPAPANVIAAWS